MKPENWQQVKEIFYSVLERTPAEREIFFAENCSSDEDLRRDVEILLESYKTDYLEKPALDKFDPVMIAELSQAEIGEQINHYKILNKLGAGGMGEVFLAEDTKLNRRVAIKFLRTASVFQGQAERRLLREARSAAVLNHPNICTIHEIGTSKDRSFIVMEYVEGETLEMRIGRGNLSPGESLDIAIHIADALVEAHAHGVIHRDIKPSNVIINSRGQVKVLDFSLAKKVFSDGEETTQSLISQAGLIAGTIAYMSPEQARGQVIDARSDIWSLGVVLYEMLSGSLPFAGETKSDIIAAILTKDFPKINEVDKNLLPEINQIIDKSLQKDRNNRFTNAQDFHLQLALLQSKLNSDTTAENERAFSAIPAKTSHSVNFIANRTLENEGSTDSEMLPAAKDSSFYRIVKTVKHYRFAVLLLIGVAMTSLVGWQIYQNYPKDTRSFLVSSRSNLQISNLFGFKRKSNETITDVSFSPDGKLFSFLISGEGSNDIYIKQLDQGEPIRITDGKGINQTPVWSPDGQRIAFVSTRENNNAIWSISYLGGTPKLETKLEEHRFSYQLKKWSNDEKRIFYESSGKLKTIELGSGRVFEIKLPEVEVVGGCGSFNISKDENFVVFVVDENAKERIWVQSLENGKAWRISENDYLQWSPVLFPENDRFAYSSDQNGNFQIFVNDLEGSEPTQITFGESNASDPVISPDGQKILFLSKLDEANIFSFDLKSGKETQHTSNTKLQIFPNISPDNEKMVFQVTDDNYKIASSPLKIKLLENESKMNQIAQKGGMAKWSPKGDSVAFVKLNGTINQLWKVDVDDLKEKQLTANEVFYEGLSLSPYNLMSIPFSWSPDGRKLVYSSKEDGFNNLWIIGADGGDSHILTNNNDNKTRFSSPIWSSNGKTIAFIQRHLTAPTQLSYEVLVLENGQTKSLFQTNSLTRLLGWSKNGTEVLVVVAKTASVEIIQLNTETNSQPKTIFVAKGANIHCFSSSNDGEKIAFATKRNGIDNLYIVRKDGSETQITENTNSLLYYSGLIWSFDDNKLFYSKQTGGIQISMISDSK